MQKQKLMERIEKYFKNKNYKMETYTMNKNNCQLLFKQSINMPKIRIRFSFDEDTNDVEISEYNFQLKVPGSAQFLLLTITEKAKREAEDRLLAKLIKELKTYPETDRQSEIKLAMRYLKANGWTEIDNEDFILQDVKNDEESITLGYENKKKQISINVFFYYNNKTTKIGISMFNDKYKENENMCKYDMFIPEKELKDKINRFINTYGKD